MRWSSTWIGVALAVAGVALVFLPVGDFHLFLVTKAAAWMLAMVGLNLALGFTGLFSFAHISLYAIGAYAAAIAVSKHGLPVWAGFALAVALGAAWGAVLSLATFRARATHFAVVSLVLMFAVSELLSGLTGVTGGEIGISVRRPMLGGEALGPRNYWLFALVITVVAVVLVRNLVRSPLGRGMVAVRESERAAGALGIDPLRYRMLAMAAGGAVAAVGGALFAHLDGYVSPQLAGFGAATLLIASLLVGGPGSLWGPVLGAAYFLGIDRGLTALERALPGVDIQALVSGVVLFLVVVLLPRGLAGIRLRRDRRADGDRRAGRVLPRTPEAPAGRGPTSARHEAAVLPAPRRPAPQGPVLEVRGLTMAFGGVRAVDRLDLLVQRGTIHGLIGPNGAGKTTTINLVTGVLRPTGGEMRLLGEPVGRARPHRMARMGLGRVFQQAEVLPGVSAEENVLTGFHLVAERNLLVNLLRLPGGVRRERQLRAEARTLLAALGLEHRARMPAGSMPYGERRLLEVARALAARPTVLVLDEPATGLTAAELQQLAAVLRRLREAGVTVLLIEHNMEFLMGLCDTVSVLDYGGKIAEGTPEEIQSNPRVIEAYLGREAG